MGALHAAIAFGPLAVYCLMLGLIHRSGRAVVTTGTREIYAVGLAVCGFVVVGPLTLFIPDFIARQIGASLPSTIAAWGFMLVGYSLLLSLIIFLIRPRVVVYNVSVDRIRDTLQQLIEHHQLEHEWAGRCLALPTLGIQLQIERGTSPRTVSLIATSGFQWRRGWRFLEQSLAFELREATDERLPGKFLFLAFSVVMLLTLLGALAIEDPQTILADLDEVWRP